MQHKMQQMIDDGICDGIYKETVDHTSDDMKTFKSFLYRNFYWKYERYKKILPKSNQSGQLLRLINLFPAGNYMFKVNNRNIGVVLVALLLTLNIFNTFCSGVSIIKFERVNAGWKVLRI